jgi:hypothetical protein
MTTNNATTLSVANTATGQLVDRFGRLKAEAADVAERLDEIKTVLVERCGESKNEGEQFRLALSHSLRTTTDWKAVAAALARTAGISDKALDALIAENTNVQDSWVARCNARVTK